MASMRVPPLPPSESSPRELEKLRYMDQLTTAEAPLPHYGRHDLAVVVIILAVFLIVGSVAFYSLVLGSARIVVSDVSMSPGVCQSIPSLGYASSTLDYGYTLTNPTARNATAALDFYADGQLVDTSWFNSVAAGQSIGMHHSVDVDFCNATTGRVVVRSSSYL